MLCVVCCVLWLYFHRYLLWNQTNLDNGILHTDPKSTTLGPQLIFISKKPPFEPRPVSVFKAGENACKDCFWSFLFIKILFQTASDNESTAINGNAYIEMFKKNKISFKFQKDEIKTAHAVKSSYVFLCWLRKTFTCVINLEAWWFFTGRPYVSKYTFSFSFFSVLTSRRKAG